MKKLLSLFLLFSHFAFAQTPRFVSNQLDSLVNRAIVDWQIPGAAVAIVKDGKVVFMKGYGTKEVGKNDPIDENTLFMVASNSKAFTGTLISWLDFEKKLSLNDKVSKWLPNFKLYDPNVTALATVADLLCHRVGLKTFQGDWCYWGSNLSRAEVVQKFGLHKPVYDFRAGYGYCNAGFLTAGELIPAATNNHQLWEDMLQERILTPLGMSRTLPLTQNFLSANNISLPHTFYDGKVVKTTISKIDNLGSAASICSSVADMSKWMMMQLDTGKYLGKQIIPKEVVLKTWKAHNLAAVRKSSRIPSTFSAYGLGFFIQDYAGKLHFSHTGGADGFVTSFAFIPEERLGVIVLTNSDMNNFFDLLKYYVFDAYLNRPYKDYNKAAYAAWQDEMKEEAERLAKEREQIAKKQALELPLEAYSGSYMNTLYGKMEAKVENNQLRLYFEHHPDCVGILEPKGGNEFLATYTNKTWGILPVKFEVKDKKVLTSTIKVNDFIEYDPYIFEKLK